MMVVRMIVMMVRHAGLILPRRAGWPIAAMVTDHILLIQSDVACRTRCDLSPATIRQSVIGCLAHRSPRCWHGPAIIPCSRAAIIAGTFVLEDAATVLAAMQVSEGKLPAAVALGIALMPASYWAIFGSTAWGDWPPTSPWSVAGCRLSEARLVRAG